MNRDHRTTEPRPENPPPRSIARVLALLAALAAAGWSFALDVRLQLTGPGRGEMPAQEAPSAAGR